jgi:multidrug efflux system outer membrane protein
MKQLLLITTTLMLMSCAKQAHKQSIGQNPLPDEFTQSDENTINKINNFWNKPFNNQVLAELVNNSFDNNLDIKKAWLNLKIARSNFKLINTQNNPKLDLNFNNEISTTNYKNSNTTREETNNLDLAVSWQIDLWGKIDKYAKAENFEYQATKQDYLLTQQLITSQIISNYIAYNYLVNEIQLNKNYLLILENKLAYTNKIYQAGEVSIIDLNNAKQDVNYQNIKLNQLDDSLNLVIESIGLLSNQNIKDINIKSFEIETDKLEEFNNIDISSTRYDLKAAELRVYKQFYNTQANKLERLPSLNLTLSYGFTATSISDLTNATLFNSVAGLTMPIFNSGSIKQAIKKAETEQELALLNYLYTANYAVNEISTNYKLLNSQHNALTKQVDNLKLANDNLTVNNQLYNAGQINYLSLADYQLLILESKLNLNTLKQTYLQQLLNTYNSFGGYNKTNKDKAYEKTN